MDWVYGRPGEHQAAAPVEIPESILEVRAMAREQRYALLRELERREAAN